VITYTLLQSVRLSGTLPNDSLAIVTKRDGQSVELLEIASDTQPVTLELFHFQAGGERWSFSAPGWRVDTDAARTQLPYSSGDAFTELEITAESTAGAKRAKRLGIRIKPVVDAPDED
jgi:hypothetical protein